MTPESVSESAQAIAALLELPDPEDLPVRAFHVTYDGDPDRHQQILWLWQIHQQYRLPEVLSDAVELATRS